MTTGWELWNRVMTVVGHIATVVGTGVAIWAFVSPADLSNTLAAILQRMQSEPLLADHERYMVQSISCYESSGCSVYGNKDVTSNPAKLILLTCDAQTRSPMAQEVFGFSRTEGIFTGSFPIGAKAIDLILNVGAESGDYSIVQRWNAAADIEGQWTMSEIPSVKQGIRDCSTAS